MRGVISLPQIIYHERAGRGAALRLGCSAVIFDAAREKVLLIRRRDNQMWGLPGGQMQVGESVAEACSREVLEETGLQVRVGKLISVFSNPDRRIEYEDGRRAQAVVLTFEAEPSGGALRLSHETTAFGYFSLAEIQRLPLLDNHHERINDAFAGQPAAVVR
jgi:ADP-ribose pyrophosphatase YjhB (NUDIX family)